MFTTTIAPTQEILFFILFFCCVFARWRDRGGKEEGRRRRGRESKSNGVFIVLKFVESLFLLTHSKYMAREPNGS